MNRTQQSTALRLLRQLRDMPPCECDGYEYCAFCGGAHNDDGVTSDATITHDPDCPVLTAGVLVAEAESETNE